jgi:hypothetical protein
MIPQEKKQTNYSQKKFYRKKTEKKKKESLLERLFVIDFECKTALQECRFYFFPFLSTDSAIVL